MCSNSGVSSIGCFVCSSFDGENASCEDPFNSTADLGSKVDFYELNYCEITDNSGKGDGLD